MQSQFIPHGAGVDLTNCDREPIHAPGTIQPHGALFALDHATERVLAASRNAERFTGEPVERSINALSSDIFGIAGADILRTAALTLTGSGPAIGVQLPNSTSIALMHRTGETVFVEIESSDPEAADVIGATRDAVRGFAEIDDVQALCDAGADTLRALTGYDRVMVYRFDSDGHGSVIAEARAEAVEGFLGRHYPASDIPRQARALYRTTMLRLLVDVDAQAAELQPVLDPRTTAPWDLSRAILRSTSPIHLEYLRNMGVTATLTISLMREGELWGLIACHHQTPKYPSKDMRSATETIGHALVAFIVRLEDARTSNAHLAAQDAVLGLVMRHEAGTLEALVADETFTHALGIGGAALTGGVSDTSGNVLAPDRLRVLASWLSERGGDDVFVTDALAKINPEFADDAGIASGLYARRFGTTWFFAFRPEHVHTVDWGGDPSKPAVMDGTRLSPRGSLDLWREEVRHRAEPWESWTLAALERATRWAGKRSAR